MIEKFREFGRPKRDVSNFTKEELEDIYLEFKDTAEIYGLNPINDLDDYRLLEEGKSFYYINCAKNAYIDINYFGIDYDLLIEDLKTFVKIIKKILGFEIINGWSYKEGFSVEYKKNINAEPYVDISLVFYKPD